MKHSPAQNPWVSKPDECCMAYHDIPACSWYHPLYGQVLKLIDKGKTWVKLSGAYADTKVGPPTYADSSAVARAYAKAVPERCVWGSDWPHPSEQAKGQLPDDAVLFDLLSDWAPDEKVRHRILVENPA